MKITIFLLILALCETYVNSEDIQEEEELNADLRNLEATLKNETSEDIQKEKQFNGDLSSVERIVNHVFHVAFVAFSFLKLHFGIVISTESISSTGFIKEQKSLYQSQFDKLQNNGIDYTQNTDLINKKSELDLLVQNALDTLQSVVDNQKSSASAVINPIIKHIQKFQQTIIELIGKFRPCQNHDIWTTKCIKDVIFKIIVTLTKETWAFYNEISKVNEYVSQIKTNFTVDVSKSLNPLKVDGAAILKELVDYGNAHKTN